ncbi:MAG: hypothetical protein ABL998_20395, partial [Planctomycetota bacterium]
LASGRHASARAARWKTFMLAPPEATWSASSPAATSDSEGRFDLGTVAIPGTHLILHGPGLSYARHALSPREDLAALELVVDALVRFQVSLRQRDEADRLSLLDDRGRTVALRIPVDGLELTAQELAIDGGRSGTVFVNEGDYTLVLWKDGREVRRTDVRLEPGGPLELGL